MNKGRTQVLDSSFMSSIPLTPLKSLRDSDTEYTRSRNRMEARVSGTQLGAIKKFWKKESNGFEHRPHTRRSPFWFLCCSEPHSIFSSLRWSEINPSWLCFVMNVDLFSCLNKALLFSRVLKACLG